ncbi:(2,3-dihydroxybenzoyl)adenylate synthase [Streptomyces tsukubensis]|uniref:(2,3-dihydroxybenzoyl)adenylate synthase n=1 Tax=Streptomyces tsukubensis TaxID=83656 RepID=UPI00344F992E
MSSMVRENRAEGPDLVPYDDDSRTRYRAHGWWSGKTLPAELEHAAREHAGRPALVTPEGTWTYERLFGEARAFAAGFAGQAGARPGDAVMFQMGNVAETVVAYLGCLLAGTRPVCTLPQHGVREVGLLAEHTGARFLISQADFRDGRLLDQARQLRARGSVETVVVARGDAPSGGHSYDGIVAAGRRGGGDPLPCTTVPPDDIAVFQLSGGTTGLPKIAPRLHEEYAYNSRVWAEAMGYGPESRLLYRLPIMHNAGLSLAVQPAVLAGSCLVLAPSAEITGLLDLVEEHRPDILPLVPPALAIRLLESPEARRTDLSCVRDFVVGGQKLPAEIAERLRDELGIRVRQMFGMAEGMFMLTPSKAAEEVRHHTVGTPIAPGDEVRILQPGGEDEVEDGEIGEFAARGPYTIRGYYRAPEHNRNSFTADGFYRSGDLARRHVTADGVYYSIEGRIKDVINRGVEKIHAEEIEELIVQHPSVSFAALVAMPDPVLGEKGCAYLVLEPGTEPLTVNTLGEHLLGLGVARYKLPERVEIVDTLPLTNVGKVSKKTLRGDIERKLTEETGESR